MAWRDNLREASFQDVPFYVAAADDEYGRRIVHNEFPGRDLGTVQDFGRKDDIFTIEAFLFGDYERPLKKLEKALNEEGAGTLVHPWRGVRTVVCAGYSTAFNKDDGGYVALSIKFIRARFRDGLVISGDLGSRLSKAAAAASAAAEKSFLNTFSLAGLPAALAGLSNSALKKVLDTVLTPVSDAVGGVKEFAAGTQDLFNSAAAWAGTVQAFKDDPLGALLGGAGFPQNIRDMFQFPSLSKKAKLVALRRFFYDFGGKTEKTAAAAAAFKKQVDDNDRALSGLIRQAAVIEAAAAVTDVDFDTYDEAVKIRDELADVLESEAVSVADVGLSQKLTALQAAVVEAVSEKAADLKSLSSYQTADCLPACVIAYEIYGNHARADEIIRRNPGKIKNPLFVPAGLDLEVIV